MRKIIPRGFTSLLLLIIFTASLLPASAQQGGTTTYVYDNNGRLHAVISPSGEAAVYEYDAAGNITEIRRLAANALAIFSFAPHEGQPGDQVTFTGVGFGGGVTNVSFNGASAEVVSVTPSRVVATVPLAATTGLVTITTPTGSVSTATPFTLAGVLVTPSFAAVYFGESVQFSAQVLPPTFNQNVQWSVDGINGGNANIGTISATGLYISPAARSVAARIRATSIADNERFGEAQVRVSDPADVQSVFAPSVSVRRGDTVGVAALTQQVAVQYGVSGDSQSALSKSIAVQFGDVANQGAALSPGVSVQRGISGQASALANSIAVQYGSGSLQFSALNAISVTPGPYIQTLTPGDVTRGTTVTMTVNGVGLSGTTAIRFITSDGANDASITVSNIVVNGDGTSLTATVTVSAVSALGSRTVFISTPNGDSITVNLGINIINVQ